MITRSLNYHNSGFRSHKSFSPVREKDSDIKQMLSWQQECVESGADKKHLIIKAPPGSGKSLAAVWLAIDDILTSNYSRKQLIVVPQNHISISYIGTSETVLRYKNKTCVWRVLQNACIHPERTRRLKEFLLADFADLIGEEKRDKDPIRIQGLNCIATHANLIHVWSTLTEKEKHQIAKNLTLYIDECHHITSYDQMNVDPDDVKAMTYIGLICKELLRWDPATLKMRFMTATFYRGDGREIINKEDRKKFFWYVLDWEEFLSSLNIQDFHFDYVPFKKSPLKKLSHRIQDKKDRRHLIVFPATGHKFREKNKKVYSRYLKQFCKILPEDQILDLVHTRGREKRKQSLYEYPERYHLVTACNLFNEGTDWPPCDCVHNLSYGASLPKLVQISGRAFRKYHNKSSINIYFYIAEGRESATREEFADHLNAILSGMLLDSLFRPIKVPVLSKALERFCTQEQKQSLSVLMGDDIYNQMQETLLRKYESLLDKDNVRVVRALAEDIAQEFHDDSDLNEYLSRQDFIDAILAMLVKNQQTFGTDRVSQHPLESIDIGFIRQEGFDEIWTGMDAHGSLIYGTTQPLSISQLRQLRTILKSREEFLTQIYRDSICNAFCDTSSANIGFKQCPFQVVQNQWIEFSITSPIKTFDGRSFLPGDVFQGMVLDSNNGTTIVKFYRDAIQILNGMPILCRKNQRYKLIGDIWKPDFLSEDASSFLYPDLQFIEDDQISMKAEISTSWVSKLI